MNYKNEQQVRAMIYERGSDLMNFNVEKSIELSINDEVYFARGEFKKTVFIKEILETRQSSLKNFNYVRVRLTEKF